GGNATVEGNAIVVPATVLNCFRGGRPPAGEHLRGARPALPSLRRRPNRAAENRQPGLQSPEFRPAPEGAGRARRSARLRHRANGPEGTPAGRPRGGPVGGLRRGPTTRAGRPSLAGSRR